MKRSHLSFALAFGVLMASAPASAETVSGPAKALSGDTLEVAGRAFFINGVVAPKGTGANFALESLVAKGKVTCKTEAHSQGSHPTATCTVGSKDIGVELISVGAAVVYEENETNLADHQLQEHPAIAGLEEGLTPPRDCLIKGNVSGGKIKDKIYHLPGDPHYLRTKVDIARGEMWFCAEEDAKAAGFRHAGE